MTKIHLIGDVHGYTAYYDKIIKTIPKNELSIQLGDFGFKHEHLWHKEYILNKNRKILFGNHDYYPLINSLEHSLTPSFKYFEDLDLLAIRGAYSIDKQYRTSRISWWEEEELNYEELANLINLYEKVKPRYVVSHTCPEAILNELFGNSLLPIKSKTGAALDNCFEIFQPEKWIFGHFHYSRTKNILGCEFKCLTELEYYILEIKRKN